MTEMDPLSFVQPWFGAVIISLLADLSTYHDDNDSVNLLLCSTL
jgi:hypothetical protein